MVVRNSANVCQLLGDQSETNSTVRLSPSHTGLRTSCDQLATEIPATNLRQIGLHLHKIFDRRMFGECWANDRQYLSILFHFKAYIRQILAQHSAIIQRFSAIFRQFLAIIRRFFGNFSAIIWQRSPTALHPFAELLANIR